MAGHNEDWYPEEIHAQTIRIVRLTGKWSTAAYISAGPAYNMPITGVTAAGFSSAANTVYYRDERVGVPNNLLLTTVLGQPDLEHVKELLTLAPRARGSEPPALRRPRARVRTSRRAASAGRSSTARRLRRRPPPQATTALFVHTNHYVSPELAPGDASDSEGTPPAARARHGAV